MQMLNQICGHLGLEKPATDPESKDLAQATPVTALVEEIEKAREVGAESTGAGGDGREGGGSDSRQPGVP